MVVRVRCVRVRVDGGVVVVARAHQDRPHLGRDVVPVAGRDRRTRVPVKRLVLRLVRVQVVQILKVPDAVREGPGGKVFGRERLDVQNLGLAVVAFVDPRDRDATWE